MSETVRPITDLYAEVRDTPPPSEYLNLYQQNLTRLVGEKHLTELTDTTSTGETMWSNVVAEHAWDVAGRIATGHEMHRSELEGRTYRHDNIDLMTRALHFHGFNQAMATGVSAAIGNRAMRGHPLSESEKDTLRSIPINNWSALNEVISYTLAAYKEGFEESKKGRIAVASGEYLRTLAEVFTVVGNNFVRPSGSGLPTSINSLRDLKVKVIIEGHTQHLLAGNSEDTDPYLSLGRAFRVRSATGDGTLVPLDVAQLDDLQGHEFRQTLSQAEMVYQDILSDATAKQKGIRKAGGIRKGGVVTAVAATTSILLGQQAAAANTPATHATSVPTFRDSSITVTAVYAPSASVSRAPTDIAKYVTVAPVVAEVQEATPLSGVHADVSALVTSKTVEITQLDTSDPMQTATLAATEGASDATISTIIGTNPGGQQENSPQTNTTSPEKTGIGSDKLRVALLNNADLLSKLLESDLGASLGETSKSQIDVYTQYIRSAADDPSVLNALMLHKDEFTEGKMFSGQENVVKALMPQALKFFDNKKYAGNTLSKDQVQLLAGLWATAKANLMTEDEISTLLAPKTPPVSEIPDGIPSDNSREQSEIPKQTIETLADKAFISYVKNLTQDTPGAMDGETLAKLILKYEDEYKIEGIDRYLEFEQLWQESRANPNAVSPAGAIGLAQFMPGTWESWGNGKDPRDPAAAVDARFRYMKSIHKLMIERFPNKSTSDIIALTLAGYNAGPYNQAIQEGRVPQNGETNRYVDIIMGRANDARAKAGSIINKAKEDAKEKARAEAHRKEAEAQRAGLWPGLSEESKATIQYIKSHLSQKNSQLKEYATPPQIERLKKAGYQNGKLPKELLKKVDSIHPMYVEAADAFMAMRAQMKKDIGVSLTILPGDAAAYRSYDSQTEIRNQIAGECHCNPPAARVAKPGTSKHGWGLAVDFDNIDYDTPTYNWLIKHAREYGFYHDWVHDPTNNDRGAYREPWHWNWFGMGKVN